jgi:hypothetical protein
VSVLIKGIELPEKVQVLELHSDGKVFTRKGYLVGEAVELPEKHGRLIDADALIKFVEDRYEITWESDCYEGGIKDACSDIIEKIDTMPTVIEAEDGE